MDDPIRILFVDNDDIARRNCAEALSERDGLTVTTAASATEGFERLDDDIDCILSDLEMPVTDGIEFLEQVRAKRPDFPFLLFSARQSAETVSRALDAGASDYVFKQTCTESCDLLVNRIETVVQNYRARQRLSEQGVASMGDAAADTG